MHDFTLTEGVGRIVLLHKNALGWIGSYDWVLFLLAYCIPSMGRGLFLDWLLSPVHCRPTPLQIKVLTTTLTCLMNDCRYWEDDSDEDAERAPPKPESDSDEDDPLDAFMANLQVKWKPCSCTCCVSTICIGIDLQFHNLHRNKCGFWNGIFLCKSLSKSVNLCCFCCECATWNKCKTIPYINKATIMLLQCTVI